MSSFKYFCIINNKASDKADEDFLKLCPCETILGLVTCIIRFQAVMFATPVLASKYYLKRFYQCSFKIMGNFGELMQVFQVNTARHRHGLISKQPQQQGSSLHKYMIVWRQFGEIPFKEILC